MEKIDQSQYDTIISSQAVSEEEIINRMGMITYSKLDQQNKEVIDSLYEAGNVRATRPLPGVIERNRLLRISSDLYRINIFHEDSF